MYDSFKLSEHMISEYDRRFFGGKHQGRETPCDQETPRLQRQSNLRLGNGANEDHELQLGLAQVAFNRHIT